MTMRKRRKHVAGIPRRDNFTRRMWACGLTACFVAFNRRWVQMIKWSDNL